MLYVGLDLHQRTSTSFVVNENGKPMPEYSRTLAGPPQRMVGFLEELARDQPIAVCYEASLSYGVIHDQLARFAQRVEVAHPGKLALIYRSRRKNDRADAKALATLLLLNAVPKVHVPHLDIREWRNLIQFRRHQVEKRVQTKNGLRSLLRQQVIVPPREVGGLWSSQGRAWLAQVAWPTGMTGARARILQEELALHDRLIGQVTRELDAIAKDHPGVALLKTIPGVGPRTAEALRAMVDDPDRFERSRSLGAYLGLTPCEDTSADRKRLGHITKQGPSLLRKLLVESAWHLVRRCPKMQAIFERIAQGKKDRRKIAIVAVARRLAVMALAMLKTGEAYRASPPPPPAGPASTAA